MSRKLFALVTVVFCLVIFTAALAQDKDVVETPKEGASAPEVVYMQYVRAVHSGDLKTIEKLVYSRGWDYLWKKSPAKMLAMAKNIVPKDPSLQSKEETQEYQYRYTVLKYVGTSPRNTRIHGEIRMILEGGEWKVYQEQWR